MDRAVWLFGSSLQAELDGVEGEKDKAKRERQRILKLWIPEAAVPIKYADPATMVNARDRG